MGSKVVKGTNLMQMKIPNDFRIKQILQVEYIDTIISMV